MKIQSYINVLDASAEHFFVDNQAVIKIISIPTPREVRDYEAVISLKDFEKVCNILDISSSVSIYIKIKNVYRCFDCTYIVWYKLINDPESIWKEWFRIIPS